MTTIPNLPEELLLLIFKEMWPSPPTQCQYVCKSWYRAAHKLVLKHIQIPFTNIPKFIASINHNPDPAYLNAVQVICIQDDYNTGTQQPKLFDKEMIEKMLYRFPNLKAVWLNDTSIVYDDFNDQVCKEILKRCPKLDTFEIVREIHFVSPEKQDEFLDTHLKLRLLLTAIHLPRISFSLEHGGFIDFVTKFPRLKKIQGVHDLNKFRKLLPAFEQLSHLESIIMEKVVDDQEGFAEFYLARRPKDKQTHIVQALASVKDLAVDYKETFGVNSIQFIAKYFTGLRNFTMFSYNSYNLTSPQQALLANTIMDLICTTKDTSLVYFSDVKRDDLKTYLASIVSKLYQDASLKRLLKVEMQSESTPSRKLVHLKLESGKFMQKINIKLSNRLSLRNIAVVLPPTIDVDHFIIDINESSDDYERSATISMYDDILTTMPSLKNVTLKIPESYVHDSSPAVYPLVESTTLQLTAGDKSQAILDEFTTKFPNLKELKLFYFCGTWNSELNTQQLCLSRYSSERLALDLTSLTFKKHEEDQTVPFIVLRVSLITSNEEYLYKIMPGSTYTDTSISETDLIKDDVYVCAHVTINSLERLDVYIFPNADPCDIEYACNSKHEFLTPFNNQM